MTVLPGQTKFRFVLAKGPKGRKLRSASEFQESSQDSLGSREKSRNKSHSKTRDSTRSNTRGDSHDHQRKQSLKNSRVKAWKSRHHRAQRDPSDRSGQFILYVEGPRDREILGCWARRVDIGLARCIEKNTVILGGRRPARAISDFRKRGGIAAGFSGLIVLDRDHHAHAATELGRPAANGISESSRSGDAYTERETTEVGLELFVWSLRHIESYLLVPAAIRRMLGLEADDRRVERSIEQTVAQPNDGSPSMRTPAAHHASLHAKRILGSGGSLSEALGTELRAGDIARAMHLDELHGDVHRLFDRIGSLSGLAVKAPEVVFRS
jgi:hypothetical protein